MHGSINDDNANRKMFVVNTGGFIKNAQYRSKFTLDLFGEANHTQSRL